jgi:hypothetical protein
MSQWALVLVSGWMVDADGRCSFDHLLPPSVRTICAPLGWLDLVIAAAAPMYKVLLLYPSIHSADNNDKGGILKTNANEKSIPLLRPKLPGCTRHGGTGDGQRQFGWHASPQSPHIPFLGPQRAPGGFCCPDRGGGDPPAGKSILGHPGAI